VAKAAAGRLGFRPGARHVRVPATSANLGPGFDSFALALTLYDEVVAQASDAAGIRVDVHGEGAESVPRDEKHLVVKAMMAGFDALGARPHGLDLVCTNRIPHGRGLGSSAAAIVSGLLLARALTVGGDEGLPDEELLDLATLLEGHPDNVAACLRGGFTISWTHQTSGITHADAVRLGVVPTLLPVVCVPTHEVATHLARGLLPAQVPHVDAATNVARAALLVAVLAGAVQSPGRASTAELLLTATADLLHQPYRSGAYPRSAELVGRLRAAGMPAVISGAGPSVLVLAAPATADTVADLAGEHFATSVLAVAVDGARILPTDF
jgi:homoserine kinase